MLTLSGNRRALGDSSVYNPWCESSGNPRADCCATCGIAMQVPEHLLKFAVVCGPLARDTAKGRLGLRRVGARDWRSKRCECAEKLT
jgi:hypothetical protein